MSLIADNVRGLREKIRKACERASRNPDEITLVAVSKGFPHSRIREVVNAGIADIGENYLQEAIPKQDALKGLPIHWHFTGHLQRNKAEVAARRFALIQSVDSRPLAETLKGLCEKMKKPIRVLLEVKTSPEAAHGFLPEELLGNREGLYQTSGVEIAGLMTMGFPMNDPEAARPFFRKLRLLFEELRPALPATFKELSMGMSGDFQIAVEEGATMVRIGRAIFGERPRRIVGAL